MSYSMTRLVFCILTQNHSETSQPGNRQKCQHALFGAFSRPTVPVPRHLQLGPNNRLAPEVVRDRTYSMPRNSTVGAVQVGIFRLKIFGWELVLLRFDSGAKRFAEIPARHFSTATDGFTLRDDSATKIPQRGQ